MFDTGSTSFMLICTMLVLLMTPGVAFFYGGLARRKNVVNTMFMSMAIIGVVGVLWIIAGWSFAYGGDGSNPFFGGFDQLGCASVVQDMLVEAQVVPEDAVYPATTLLKVSACRREKSTCSSSSVSATQRWE